MDVARATNFSVGNQIILRESTTILKVHTFSDITTLDGNKIKTGVIEGILDNRTSVLHIVHYHTPSTLYIIHAETVHFF